MALDVYFREQIQRGIVSTLTAILAATAANGASNVEFVRGALSHARSQADLYGLDWAGILGEVRTSAYLGSDLTGLLDRASAPEAIQPRREVVGKVKAGNTRPDCGDSFGW